MRRHINKLWILPLIIFGLTACSNGNTDKRNNPEAEEVGKTEQPRTTEAPAASSETIAAEAVPMAISEEQFSEKVFDFRSGSQWKYKGDKPCIIDFYADWCGPCRMIAPYMKEFAKTYQGDIYVYKINTDYAQDLSMFFEINAIPAVMLCPMKGQYQMVVGANSKEKYDALIRSVLLNQKS